MTAILALFLSSVLICGLSAAEERVATNQPKFVSKGGHLTVKEGADIELECEVHDLGEYVILWKFNKSQVLFAGNLRIYRDERISRNDKTGSVLIKDFRAENSGEYICQVSTNPPKDIVYFVHILGPPLINVVNSNEIVVKKSDPIVITCDSNAETIEWKKENRVLANHKVLTIESAKPDDSGIYECIASNEIGQSSHEFKVSVLFAPELETGSPVIHAPIGQPVLIECVVNSEPAANINWFGSGNEKLVSNQNIIIDRINKSATLKIVNVSQHDYDNYSCVANNSLGSAVQMVQVTGKPSIPIITSPPLAGKGSSYRLKWVLNSESEIEKYEIKYRKRDSKEWTQHVFVPTQESQSVQKWNSFQVSDLEEDQNYELYISAQNAFGVTSSDIYSFVTSLGQLMRSTSYLVLISLLFLFFCK